MSVSVGAISGFHSGMHDGSLLILLGAWAIVGILILIVKAIISSLYPESINQCFDVNSDLSSSNEKDNKYEESNNLP
ncbi:MAG: hypothetical protein PHU40_11805 [Sulfurimonas sp.]|nr:hypothetical protein [Sulfurimonas sp.]